MLVCNYIVSCYNEYLTQLNKDSLWLVVLRLSACSFQDRMQGSTRKKDKTVSRSGTEVAQPFFFGNIFYMEKRNRSNTDGCFYCMQHTVYSDSAVQQTAFNKIPRQTLKT